MMNRLFFYRKKYHLLKKLSIACLVSSILAGCAVEKTSFENLSDREIYQSGHELFQSRNYEQAVQAFEALESEHPFSPLATKALVMNIFSNHLLGDYDQSILNAKRFIALYPNDKNASYAYYMVAYNHLMLVPDEKRDTKSLDLAIQSFQETINRYPNTNYALDSYFQIQLLQYMQDAYDIETGRFYMERGSYLAAIRRFQSVLLREKWSEFAPESLFRLVEIFLTIGLTDEAKAYAYMLNNRYKTSAWNTKASSLMSEQQHNVNARRSVHSVKDHTGRTITKTPKP